MSAQAEILPSAAEMIARLSGVHDDVHFVEHFYPLLAQMGGQSKTPMEMVAEFANAVRVYVRTVEESERSFVQAYIALRALPFFRAMAPNDSFATEAKDYWRTQGRAEAQLA